MASYFGNVALVPNRIWFLPANHGPYESPAVFPLCVRLQSLVSYYETGCIAV